MVVQICLILATLVFGAPECNEANLAHGFSECFRNKTRTAYYYWKDECEEDGLLLPEPIADLDCLLHCEAGTFLDIDLENQSSTCSPCPANTYNIGGGVKWAGAENDWANMESKFTSYCWTSGWLTWHMGQNCTVWNSIGDGEAVVSGETTDEAWVESQLIYYDHLVTDGTLTVSYTKSSRVLNGFNNGEFSIYVNGKREFVDDEPGESVHATKTLDLAPGKVEIIIVYEKYNDANSKDLSAMVDYFELRGTAHSAHTCYPCKVGFSKEGSSSCDLCEAGYYHELYEGEPERLGECLPCGDEEYSEIGSIGADSCQPKKPCNKDDYAYTWSNCVNDSTRAKRYSWNQPHICSDVTGVQLPPDEPDHPCATCNPGDYHEIIDYDTNESVCKPCEDGTYLTETTEIENQCSPCSAGTFAPKSLNYTLFTGQTETDFQNKCSHSHHKSCSRSQGWIENGEELTTGGRIENNANLILEKTIEVTAHNAYFETEISLENFEPKKGFQGSFFMISVDQVTAAAYFENESHKSVTMPLEKGLHTIRWIFHHKNEADVLARIHRIVLYGVDEGSAASCEKCPVGTISGDKSSRCEPCGIGFSSNEDNTACVACEHSTYNDEVGNPLGCMICPGHSYPNSNHTLCVGHKILSFEEASIDIRNMTGVGESEEAGYENGICERERMQPFCRDTFYGPIDGLENFFYLSVLNPSNFELPQYAKVDELPFGYAYGVLRKMHMSLSADHFSLPDDVCVNNFEHLVVNLGSRIEQVIQTQDGFHVRYTDGSPCDLEGLEKYKSSIHFVCDKSEGDGWPSYSHSDKCEYFFRWKTVHACKVCGKHDLQKIESSCYDGERTVSVVEGKECRILDGKAYSETTESCSRSSEWIKSWPVIFGLVSIGILSLVALVLFVYYCRIRSKYNRLIEDRDDAPQGSQIELS